MDKNHSITIEDERKRSEMNKMNNLYDCPMDLGIQDLTYLALCKPTENACHVYLPDFPTLEICEQTMENALLQAKAEIQKELRRYKHPPIPSKQENVMVPEHMFLMLMKIA